MKLREIERLRALAILGVMTHHWLPAHAVLPRWLQDGSHGVDLFFVISGFVVTKSLLRPLPVESTSTPFMDVFRRASPVLRAFFTRRFFRIVPLVVALLVVHRLLDALSPTAFGTPEEWRDETIAILSTTYNYAKALRPAADFNQFGVYWSLCVEEHFYLTLPVLLLACRTTGRRVAAAAALIAGIALVLRPLAYPEHQGDVTIHFYETFSSHLRFDSLLAGVVLALLLEGSASSRPILPRALLRFVLLPAAMLVVWAMPNALPPPAMAREGYVFLWFFSGILVAFAALDRGYVLEIPVLRRALEHIGARSYALYLVHVDMARGEGLLRDKVAVYAKLTARGDVRFWCLFAATLLVAEILYRGVEQPFLRLGRKLADRAVITESNAAQTA